MTPRLAASLIAALLLVVPASGTTGSTGGAGFRDAAGETGLSFTHRTGRSGSFHMREISCGGVALLDVEGDGDLDVVFVQGERRAGDGDRLFLNRLEEGELRFTEAAGKTGLPETGYGCGIAAGDWDGDGLSDLLVTGSDGVRLLRNLGGRFEDSTEAAGLDVPGWSSSASFFDADGDGHLDVWIVRYLEIPLGDDKVCRSAGGGRDYCHPDSYPGVSDRLYRNLGDGRFRDVSAEAGIDRAAGKGLGVVAADLDSDGRPDVYVANDGEPNRMWLRRADGTYRDEAMLAGTGVDATGAPEASMGVLAEDLDGDLDVDLFLTHLTGESHTLYRNEGDALFADATAASGLAASSFAATGWGLAAFDPDLDGDLDLWVGNGAVRTLEARADAGDPFPYQQRDQLFRNRGEGRFEDWSDPILGPQLVTRAVASGDLDEDGDEDLVLVHAEGPARLILTEAPAGRHWLGLEVVDAEGRPALGAVVVVEPEERPAVLRRVATDGSYAAAGDPRIQVGLGTAGKARVRVRWPDGREDAFGPLEADRYHRLRPRTGEPPP